MGFKIIKYRQCKEKQIKANEKFEISHFVRIPNYIYIVGMAAMKLIILVERLQLNNVSRTNLAKAVYLVRPNRKKDVSRLLYNI